MKNYIAPNTYNAGNVKLSEEKFRQVRDEILKISFIGKIQYNGRFQRINEIMMKGDTQPAVVYSVNPLIISAYSDEMDGVVFLEFPDELVEMYNLYEGMRLVTSNGYDYGFKVAKEISASVGYKKRYADFIPIVQLFLTDSENYAMGRTELFDEKMWDRVNYLTKEHSYSGKKARKGFYYMTKINGGMIFCIFAAMAGIGLAMLTDK